MESAMSTGASAGRGLRRSGTVPIFVSTKMGLSPLTRGESLMTQESVRASGRIRRQQAMPGELLPTTEQTAALAQTAVPDRFPRRTTDLEGGMR